MITARPLLAAVAVAVLSGPALSPCSAQDTSGLNTKVEKLRQEYARGAVGLATEYEKAGDPAAAIALLEDVNKIVPDAPGLKEKLAELQEDVLSAGETTLTIDAPTEWVTVAQVREGAKFRLTASGGYRISMTGAATVEGLPPGDAKAGLVPEHPLGALIGAYVDPAALRPRGGQRDDKQKLPEVFPVAGKDVERTAAASGVLMVRLNLPPGAKVNGKLRVMMSGQISPASTR